MEAADLDASELSARTGISTSYMSRILNGEIVNPTIDFVKRIAAALGVTETELVREDVEYEDGQSLRKRQAIPTPMPTAARAAKVSPFETTGEAIDRMIAAKGISREEEGEMAAKLIERAEEVLELIILRRYATNEMEVRP